LIILPLDYNSPYYPLNCYVNTQQTSCSIAEASRTIKILVSTDVTTTPTNLTLSLLNPRSLQPTGSFLVQIYDSSNNLIETSNGLSGLNVTMLGANNFVTESF
jgi:hypothetical protein